MGKKLLVFLACLITACGGLAEGEYVDRDGNLVEQNDSGIEQETFYHYPSEDLAEASENPVLLGTAEQEMNTTGFFGIKADTSGLGRGALCTGSNDNQQICWLPPRKLVRVYVNLNGFTAVEQDVIANGLLDHFFQWGPDWYGYTDLGWSWEIGSVNDHNMEIRAGGVASLYPKGDSRHWIQIGCEQSTTLTENPSQLGSWKRCGKFVLTIDMSKITDDGVTGAKNPRLRQSVGQAVGLGTGMGVTNINPGTVFQTKAAGTLNLSYDLTNTNLCGLDLFSSASNTTVTRLASNACDGWSF